MPAEIWYTLTQTHTQLHVPNTRALLNFLHVFSTITRWSIFKSTFETHFTSVRWQNSKWNTIFNEDLFENWLDGGKCFYMKRQFEGRGLNIRGLDDVSGKGKSFQWRSKLVMKDYDNKPLILLLTKTKTKWKHFPYLKFKY